MDDELKQLEDELRHFKPVGSSSALLERIERDLRPKRRLFPVWAPLPGLIALGVGALIVFKQPSSAGAGVPAFKPVSANSVVLKSSDDGYITLTDGSVAKENAPQFGRHDHLDRQRLARLAYMERPTRRRHGHPRFLSVISLFFL